MFNKKVSEEEIDRFLNAFTPKANHVIFRGIITSLAKSGFLHRRRLMAFTKAAERKERKNHG